MKEDVQPCQRGTINGGEYGTQGQYMGDKYDTWDINEGQVWYSGTIKEESNAGVGGQYGQV